MTVITRLDTLEAAISNERLLERAALDCIDSLMRHAIVGRDVPAAITTLDRWRRVFDERAKP